MGPKLKSLLSCTLFGVVTYDKNAARSMIPSRRNGGWPKKTEPMIIAKKRTLCPPKNFHSSCAVSFCRTSTGALLKLKLSMTKNMAISSETARSQMGHTLFNTQKNGTPFKYPRKRGGSPIGVSPPPTLDTIKIKKTT